MLFKYGEAFEITDSQIMTAEAVLSDPEIQERFQKMATGLKRIAPKANDFLYFSAVMMHAAEASLYDNDGTPKKVAGGKNAAAHWEKKGDSWRWASNDPSIRPYKNSNGDIFPEEELLKAYKKWVGKPLCIDHKSNSVDFIRGVIVDTYYDRAHKRVVALCALDKVSYPELARKVASGYATCVSMGTAVGKAVCSDCGTVARTETDFCVHMRTKSCYGEINLELQPIELSIVVNGADPMAKIKHILASANYLNNYAEAKDQELCSLASSDQVYSFKNKVVNDVREGLESLIKEFESVRSDKEDVNSVTTASTIVDEEMVNTDQDSTKLNNPYAFRVASEDNDALVKTFIELKSAIEQKLAKIEEDFNKLSTLGDGSRNMNMDKKGYFQGAGGVNEPTPGQPKYEKDGLAEHLREKEDRQMVGQMDTGPVEGMHPGPDSVPMSELERKKMLLRAQTDERASRRKDALAKAKQTIADKQAYYLGGGGVNEPTPGKVKYPKEDSDTIRNKEDKQQNGQAPFPGVGSVDGLHPSPASTVERGMPKDELKYKEMLARASVKLKFVAAATTSGDADRANSAWQVFSNDKLVMSASVEELSGGRVDALYDVIATREFGKKMLEKIKSVGFEKAAALYKKAADPVAAPPAAPPVDMGAPALPEAPDASGAEVSNEGGSGSTKDAADEAIAKLETAVSDVKEVTQALGNEKSEMPSEPTAEMPAATASLHKMRVELNASLSANLSKNASDLAEHIDELNLIKNLYDENNVNDSNREYVEAIAQDAIEESHTALAETMELFDAFSKYARGTEAMMKRAEKEAELEVTANEGLAHEEAEMLKLDEILDKENELVDMEQIGLEGGQEHHDAAPSDDLGMVSDELLKLEESMNAVDTNDVAVEVPEAKLKDIKDLTVKASFDLSTREGRTAYRAKLAAETVKWNPVLTEAHKNLDQTTKLDTKPSGDLAKTETREEQHAAMLDVAQRAAKGSDTPAKAKKEAEEILKLVKAGKIAHKDVDKLVAHGLDPEAVKYYKSLWSPVDGGSEFAGELVKEYAKAQVNEEIGTYKVKVARAYDLAYQMVDRGLCGSDQSVIASQVEEIMKYNDDAFESLKRVVAHHAPKSMVKEASRVPAIGLSGFGEPTFSVSPQEEEKDLYSNLAAAFSGRKY